MCIHVCVSMYVYLCGAGHWLSSVHIPLAQQCTPADNAEILTPFGRIRDPEEDTYTTASVGGVVAYKERDMGEEREGVA